MNKSQITSVVAKKTGETNATTERIVDEFLKVISDNLRSGDEVAIAGFGVFKVADRAARKGRNPKTGAEIDIPASKGVKFSAGKALKEAVNGK